MKHLALSLLLLALGAALTARAAILDDDASDLFGEEPAADSRLSLPELGLTNLLESIAPVAAEPGVDEAIARARDELRSAPEDARAHRKLGDLYLQSQRLDEAARAYWQAARTNPRNLGYLHYFGFTLLALGDHDNALRVYEELRARYPDARRVLFNLASAHYSRGEYDLAEQRVTRYLETARTEEPKAHYNLGLIKIAQGEWRLAVEQLMLAERRLPASPHVRAALVRAFRELGSLELAEKTKSSGEKQFGADAFQQLLAAPVLPAYIER